MFRVLPIASQKKNAPLKIKAKIEMKTVVVALLALMPDFTTTSFLNVVNFSVEIN